ncbi:MAG TPA: PAS domain S-box protein [Candidatus Dormibacteraeota bacterium]|nr:PAS domain S-box protein [Candidatus Dormibacteraeota bacterium]
MSPHSRRQPAAAEAGELDHQPVAVVPLLRGTGPAQPDVVGELRLRGLVDSLPDGLVIADDEGRIVYANQRLAALSGWSAAELRGQPIEMLVPERMRSLHEKHRDRFIAHPTVRPMGAGLGIVLRRKDGSEFPADISLSPLDTPGARVVLATVRDVTDRREAEERLRQAGARLEAINDVARTVLENRDTEVLKLMAVRARGMVDAEIAAVVAPSDPGRLVIREIDALIESQARGTTVAEPGSFAGECIRSRRSLMTADLTGESSVRRGLTEAAAIGPALFVPLATDERTFGTLMVGRGRGASPFTDEDMRSLELFAAQASVALEHGRIRGELQRLAIVEDRERIARELHDGIVQALFAVGLGLLSVEPLAAEEPVRGRLREAVDSIDRVIADLRRYIFGLKPQAVGMESLGDAVATLAREFEGRTGILTVVEADSRLELAGGASIAEMIQVAREALSNVARHAGATTCRITVRYEAPMAVLEIDDDGRGFDTARVPGHGYGLANLRERAAAVHGTMDIVSQPGQGTTVRLAVPVELVNE